jgi:hypothetical protein
MNGEEDEVVGFSPEDADGLIDQLDGTKSRGNADQRRQPRFSLMLGQVKTGGLAAGAEGSVWLMYPTSTGWTVSTDSCPCWGIGATLAAGDTVLIVPTDGRWLGLKVC